MSVEGITETHAEQSPDLAHQFETMEQQNDAYVVGTWTFLVTEIMFFGALFLAYTVYRHNYPDVFAEAHQWLNWRMGAANTTVLLTSSLTMALAVWAAQVKNRKLQLVFLALTFALAGTFLVIKGFEWAGEFREGHLPGAHFHYASFAQENGGAVDAAQTGSVPTISPEHAQLFFCLYFVMTGLHALHVIIGMVAMAILGLLIVTKKKSLQYFMPVEMAGLYWHFVDIVWIFLFPLFYLIPTR